MPKYMISFNDGDMKFPQSELPAVADAAHAVMRDAMEKGVWIFGGGFMGYSTTVVDGDGSVSVGPLRNSDVHIGGFCVLDVANDDEAHAWAARTAAACRCPQEVRRFMDDEEQDEFLRASRPQ